MPEGRSAVHWDARCALFWVPGRVEVAGKHTDYAGGRSLLAAATKGFCVVVARLGPPADLSAAPSEPPSIASRAGLPEERTPIVAPADPAPVQCSGGFGANSGGSDSKGETERGHLLLDFVVRVVTLDSSVPATSHVAKICLGTGSSGTATDRLAAAAPPWSRCPHDTPWN